MSRNRSISAIAMSGTQEPDSAPAPLHPDNILTPEQLAARLQVAVSWVYEKSRKRGGHGNPLPVLYCGRYLRFDWQAVCAWLRSNNSS
jgi:predicted DNA-binding transcriptional regulator AlpA